MSSLGFEHTTLQELDFMPFVWLVDNPSSWPREQSPQAHTWRKAMV
jgi:hypothetical protein